MHEALSYPEIPHVFRPLVYVFNEVKDFSFQEIKAYCEMTGESLDRFDISVLKDMEYVRESMMHGSTVNKVMEAYGWTTKQ